MNYKLIAQLAAGDIAVFNDYSNPVGMIRVLSVAFPKYEKPFNTFNLNFTVYHKYGKDQLIGVSYTTRPIVKLEDFFKEEFSEFKHGEEIEVQQGTWKKSIYLCPFPDKTLLDCHVVTGPMGGLPIILKRSKIRKPQPKEIFEYSLEEIAKLVDKPIDQIRIKK